jgi:thioredoxin-like negative regulator of GroEL
MTNLTKDTIDNFIKSNDKVLIQFGALWCNPCARIKKRMPDIRKGFDTISIGYLDIDEAQEFAQSLKIQAVPTFALYNNGVLVKTIPTSDENVIREILNDARKL